MYFFSGLETRTEVDRAEQPQPSPTGRTSPFCLYTRTLAVFLPSKPCRASACLLPLPCLTL